MTIFRFRYIMLAAAILCGCNRNIDAPADTQTAVEPYVSEGSEDQDANEVLAIINRDPRPSLADHPNFTEASNIYKPTKQSENLEKARIASQIADMKRRLDQLETQRHIDAVQRNAERTFSKVDP